MITAHCVCVLIKKNGLTNMVRIKAAEMVEDLSNFLSMGLTHDMVLDPSSWVRETK